MGSHSWGDEKKIPEAHWPDSLPELRKPQASGRPRLKRKKEKERKILGCDAQGTTPLLSGQLATTCMHTYMNTYRHKNG